MGEKNRRSGGDEFERARDELFNHIHRCGVLRASEEDQRDWMEDTIEYIGECHPALERADLAQLKEIGMRFCRPVIRGADRPAAQSSAGGDASAPDGAAAA